MEEPHRDNPLLTRGIELLGFDPFEALAEGTRSHQPALFLCSMCQWASGEHPTPLAAAGHSLGEYAALTAAGAIDFDDAVLLVKHAPRRCRRRRACSPAAWSRCSRASARTSSSSHKSSA